MRKFCKYCLIFIFAIVLCSTVYAKPLENKVIDQTFDESSYFPIKKDGQVFGFGRIEYFYKHNITDSSNDLVLKSKVKYSYELCISIMTADDFNQAKPISIRVSADIVSGNKACSINTNIGWTGFSNSADFFSPKETKYFSLCIQPTIVSKEWDAIDLNFSASDGTTFDTIRLNKTVIENARKGKKLVTNNKPVKIKTSDGGVYLIQLGNVYTRYYYSDVIYRMGYRVKMVKAPTKSKFSDRYNKSQKTGKYTLNTGLYINMSDDVGPMDIATSGFGELINYRGAGFVFESSGPNYVSAEKVKKGKWANGVITFVSNNARFCDEVRVTIDFPEEGRYATDAKTLDQFSGRMLVFQKKVNGKDVGTNETVNNFSKLYNSW